MSSQQQQNPWEWDSYTNEWRLREPQEPQQQNLTWQFDPIRRRYFYWLAHERCWVYDNGERRYQDESTQTLSGNSHVPSPTLPRFIPSDDQRPSTGRSTTFPSANVEYTTRLLNGLEFHAGGQHGFREQNNHPVPHSTLQNGGPAPNLLPSNMHSLQRGQPSTGAPYTQSQVAPPEVSVQRQAQIGYERYEQDGVGGVYPIPRNYHQLHDPKQVTDPVLLQQGGKAYKIIKETEGEQETLDPRYRKQKPGNEFFRVGKVFKILWPELPGDVDDRITIATEPRFGEKFITKIRWFVVVREGNTYCSCLPIQTYSGKGVAKKSVIKEHHAIIYTGKSLPNDIPKPKELPGREEGPMREPIRVKQNVKYEKMDPMSRVNFAKIYTVEHNVKVYDFGNVHPRFISLLRHQFVAVWSLSMMEELKPKETEEGTGEDDQEEAEDEQDEEEADPESVGDDDGHGSHRHVTNADE